jgi:hypothetical protein
VKGNPCKRCAKPIDLDWGKFCLACRVTLKIGQEKPKQGPRKKKRRGEKKPWEDAMWYRVPGSFGMGKRR